MKQSPEKLFADITQFVAESQALLKQGAIMELVGLDESVRGLCQEVLELSQEDRLRHANRLQQLLTDLKVLGESLVAHRNAMADDIKNLSDHQKANVAYRVADAVKKKNEGGDGEH